MTIARRHLPPFSRRCGARIRAHAVTLLLAVCVPMSPLVVAETVYRSVVEGITTFSDAPPDSGDFEALTIDTPAPAADGLLRERLAAMRESTDRMAETRREREKHRATLRALATPAPATSADPPAPAATVVLGHWPAYLRPHWRPIRPIKPTAPPGWSIMQPGNSQLMRPIVSSRTARRSCAAR